MVSKISGNKPAAIQAPKTKAPPKTPQVAAQPKAGWGTAKGTKGGKVAGPANHGASQVKMLSAKIDGMPAADKLIAPKGYEAISTSDKRSDTHTLIDGRTAKLDWDSGGLSLKGPGGKTVEVAGKNDKGYAEYQSEFHENFKDLKKEDMEFLQTDWDSSRTFGGVGSAGSMMSVTRNDGEYMGGAHPEFLSSLETYDARTGSKVTLDQLVSKEQMANIVATVASTLPKLRGEEGMDGQNFEPPGNIAKQVAENFALTTDAKGNTQITVAWMSGIHALGDAAATFNFAAPTDAAFRQKIGLQ